MLIYGSFWIAVKKCMADKPIKMVCRIGLYRVYSNIGK